MGKRAKLRSAALPDFIIAGVQKSATTWLEDQLRADPRVFTPRKELHFFDRTTNYERGPSWYSKHFDKAVEGQIIGEKTPDYFWTNCAGFAHLEQNKMARIRELLPNVKIIVILREPIQRFISAWHHNMRRGRINSTASFRDIVTSEHYRATYEGMLERGFYGKQLEVALAQFDRANIMVCFHDDIINDAEKVLEETRSFLGLAGTRISGKSEYSRRRSNDYKATLVGASIVSKTPRRLERYTLAFDRYLLRRFPLATVPYPKISLKDRDYLQSVYHNDVHRLNDLLETPLPNGWCEVYGT